jgi:hypothetical protein
VDVVSGLLGLSGVLVSFRERVCGTKEVSTCVMLRVAERGVSARVALHIASRS